MQPKDCLENYTDRQDHTPKEETACFGDRLGTVELGEWVLGSLVVGNGGGMDIVTLYD